MEIMEILAKQIGIMFILMMLGVILFRTEKLTKSGSKELGNILIYVIMPCVVVNAYMTEFSIKRLRGLGIMFMLSFFALLLMMMISRMIFQKHPIENFGTAFSNAGFMGIPLVQAVLGTEAVFYLSVFVALQNLLQWTYGVYIITEDRRLIGAKKILTNPVLLSMLAGFAFFLFPVELPGVVKSSISFVVGMNAPIAMISLGTYLAQIGIRELFTDKTAYASTVVRMIVTPLVIMAALLPVPNAYRTIKLVIMIVSSAPVGINLAIFAQIHDKNYIQAVKSICLSTLSSIVTMPIILALAEKVWGM